MRCDCRCDITDLRIITQYRGQFPSKIDKAFHFQEMQVRFKADCEDATEMVAGWKFDSDLCYTNNVRLKLRKPPKVMLPTFVTEHELVKKSLLAALYAGRKEAEGFASELPERHYEEGDRHGNAGLAKEDDSREFKRFDAEISKTREEWMLLSKEEIFQMWCELGWKIGEHIRETVLTEMKDVTTRSNQVVERQPDETLEDEIYRVIERSQVDFDADGKMTSIFMANPAKLKQLHAAMQRVEADPVLKAKFDAQRDRKYEEFRDREANRRLVD